MKKKALFISIGLLLLASLYFYTQKNNHQSINIPQETTSQESNHKSPPLKSDTNRYLAHAGGEIDGQRYTNSLEALNSNYALGFRIFEIDIITTSDGHLVCAHDWDTWKRFTGFKGESPPTLKEFLKHKIKEKYTPLSLEMLHEWFKNHPDATLFTDKINDPKAVSAVFTSTHQLLLKLISFHTIKAAKTLNIEFVLSENLLNDLGDNKIEELQKLNVKYILISRKSIKEKEALLLKIKDAGIKTYASHVNFEKGKDELYVFNNEMKFIYGFYADVWDFKN